MDPTNGIFLLGTYYLLAYELVTYFDLGTNISQLALPRERDAKLYEGPFM
jgi:hypothetical protein